MIGEHKTKHAKNTGLKEAIAIGLDEAFTSLEESFYDLTTDQASSFPINRRNNIAWIVMHCLENLDHYTNGVQTGKRVLPYEWRWGLFRQGGYERPKLGDAFPSPEEMLNRLNAVRSTAMETLEVADEGKLRSNCDPDSGWEKTHADAYMRTIYHTIAHVRQIWLLRGALGINDGISWPRQHWA